MPLPVLLITGFLGAGKTTFLRRLIPECAHTGQRPLLIVNEVGDVDVDGELMADLHAEQVRLVGGCVCCTLQSQLSQTLHDALDESLGDVVLIECSGLSNPVDVLNVLAAPALLPRLAVSHVVCLLDAARASKTLAVAELAQVQAATADLLILNKADRLPLEERPSVEHLVGEVAPHARIEWADRGDLGTERLRTLLADPVPSRPACACEECIHDHSHSEHGPVLPASFCTTALPLPCVVERGELERLLALLPPNVVRAKGFACLADGGWHALHRVYDTVDLTPMNGTVPSAGALLVCIGQHLDARAIRAMVARELG